MLCRICILLSLLALAPAYAATQLDPAIQLRQEQRELQRQDDTRNRQNTPLSATGPDIDALPADVSEPDSWLNAPKIVVHTNALLDDTQVDEVLAPYRSIPLGKQRLTLLVRQLNAQLVRQGLVTSHAQVTRIDRATNTVEVRLVAGTIETMRSDGKALEPGLRSAFPAADGETLVLSDLEQGVHQIQRLRMYQAEMRVLPGQSPDTSLIDLKVEEGKPWWLQLGLDNQGSKATGTRRTRATLGLENTFGRLDSITATYVNSRDSDALLAVASLPQGYNTWSVSYATSRYTQALPAGLRQRGGSDSGTLAWNRVLHLAAEGRDSVDLSLTYSDAWREIAGIRLTPERLTTLRGALIRIRQGRRWQAWGEADAVLGLDWFGATEDAGFLQRADAHAQFAKIELHGGLNRLLTASGWQYTGQADFQYSHLGLYGQDQFLLGGMGSVRGYEEGIIAGDRGHRFRHELHAPPIPLQPWQAQLDTFAFIDHGRAAVVGAAPLRLASAGIGLRLQQKHVAADLALARPIDYSPVIAPNHWRLHFTFRIDL